jgi:hypothetical protein
MRPFGTNDESLSPVVDEGVDGSAGDPSVGDRRLEDRSHWFWWILGSLFLCQCMTLQLFNSFPVLHDLISPFHDLGVWLLALRWGTLPAAYALLAFIAVWARLGLPRRFLLTVVLSSLLLTIFTLRFNGPIPNWVVAIILFLILAGYTGLLSAIAWFWRLTLRAGCQTLALPPPANTFSLQYLMAWSVVFALLFATGRVLIGNRTLEELLPDQSVVVEGLAVFAILFGANFLLATPIVISLLSTGWWWPRVLGSLLAIFPIAILESHILNQIPAGAISLLALLSLHSVQVAWILLTFAAVRWAGFRLVAGNRLPDDRTG